MIIVFAGLIGQSGLGGQAWACMQYLAGFQNLGHDVYYLEDSGEAGWGRAYDWDAEEWTDDIGLPASYIESCLKTIGLGERWIYRAGAESKGMAIDAFRDVCGAADLLIMRAASVLSWREEYDAPRRRAFIDVDPGFTQVSLAEGDSLLLDLVSRCERHFTVGQRIGRADCPIPTAGFDWQATRPPVALGHWPYVERNDASRFTAVMRWRGFRDAQHEGVHYGQKDREFPRYIDLPQSTAQPLCLALLGTDPKPLEEHGWEVVPGWVISRTPSSYRDFIQRSKAEFSVPKQGYSATRSGWLSDRSVCYLASGRPVLVGDTGIGDCVPTGAGLLTFGDPADAVAGIDAINSDYDQHRRAARALAEEWFAGDIVLPAFLDAALD